MPIQGSLEEAGLPDVLQLLALGRKTGCLAVADGEMHGEIYLDVGRISYASVTNRRDRLGDILVRNGRITREQLNLAAEEQTRGSKRQIGQILVDSGRIDRRSLEQYFRLQVEEAIYFLFTLKQGEFTFTSNRRPPHQSLLVSLDPESLLLEGARRVDEWSLIQKKVPSFDLVYRLNKNGLRGAAGADITEEQKRILPLLDGARDVDGIVDVTGMNEFDVGKALYGLVMAGFAELVERRTTVRHLDYRELLAYVVREAEFADPQRRRDAGRHIVDCPSCTDRLRGIHVRRTEGSPPAGTAAVEPQAPADAGPAPWQQPQLQLQQQPVPPAVPPVAVRTTGYGERRGQDRRTGRDRRDRERRCEAERRQVEDTAWLLLHGEQRVVARRQAERRTGLGRGHRGGDPDRRTEVVVTAAPVVQSGGREPRTTGPRKLEAIAQRNQAPSRQAAPDERGENEKKTAVRPAAAVAQVAPSVAEESPLVAEVAPPEAEASPTAPQVAEGPRPGAAVPPPPSDATRMTEPAPRRVSVPPPEKRTSNPFSKRAAARSKDIEWIVSPDQSVEMIRASRSDLRPTNGAGSGAAKPVAAPTAKAVAAPAAKAVAAPAAKPVAAPAAKPVVQAPPPEPRRSPTPATSPAEAARAVAPAPAPRPEAIRPRPEEVLPVASVSRFVPAPTRRVLPVRGLGIAAGVVLMSYLAWRMGRSSASGPAAERADTSAVSPLPTVAAAEAPPRPQPPGRERPVTSPAAPVQLAARVPVPAPPRAPTPPVETAAERRAREAAEARAAHPEPAPRAAPVPVVAVVPPPAARPAVPVVTPPVARPAAPNVATPPPPPAPAAPPAPTVGTVRGVVHDASGRALAGAQVSVRGTTLSAVTDGSGAFEIASVPDGPVVLQATATGFVAGTADVRARAGSAVAADLTLRSPPTSAEPDRELAAGGWAPADRAEATSILGGTLGAIEGLSIESISKNTSGSRPRVRVVQLTDAGERIVLSETLAGAAVRGPGPAHLTALRIVPASEAYPLSTGTASLGNILITARSSLGADVLRALLERLGDASGR